MLPCCLTMSWLLYLISSCSLDIINLKGGVIVYKFTRESDAHQFAATMTKLAIENNLIEKYADASDTANEVLKFYEKINAAFCETKE